MNKNLLIGGVLVVLLIIGGIFFMARRVQVTPSVDTTVSTNTEKVNVVIENFTFSPSTVTVHAGDTVTFTNQDSVGHSATADDNSFDTGILQKGESKTITFNSMGTFDYHCTPHPRMKAKVVVQ